MIGSTDNTKELVESFKNNEFNLTVKYYYQENQGKMIALNNLMQYVEGDLCLECDSDDYLKNNAIKAILSKYEEIKDKENVYAMVFLKYDQNLCNIGNMFKNEKIETKMFDLYFKDELVGDKALVFITKIRKQFKYRLEKNEKFVTEARMHHEMDKNYNVICFNYPIMICEYLTEGYTKNIKNVFLKNPYGYYEYFKEILNFDMTGVDFNKRISWNDYFNHSFFKYNNNNNIIKYPKFEFNCNIHNKIIEGYCKDCKINICEECLNNHINHNIIDLNKIGMNNEEIIKTDKLIKDIEINMKNMNKIKEDIISFLNKIKLNTDIINDENNNFKKYYIEYLEIIKEKLKIEENIIMIDLNKSFHIIEIEL